MSQTVNTAKPPGLIRLDSMAMGEYDVISNVSANHATAYDRGMID